MREQDRLEEDAGETSEGTPSGAGAAPSLLVAHYGPADSPPAVYKIEAADPGSVLADAARLAEELIARDGGRLPSLAVRELVGNVVHAGVEGAVVSILDSGDVLRVSDRGPGILDKERALLPGFTTADASLRRTIRGVGSGLGLARESITSLGGSLDIDDNLGGGTVVTARVPRLAAEAIEGQDQEGFQPTERQLRMLLLIVELGSVGPTPLARELGVSASTAYRDLVVLEGGGLIQTEGGGSRTISDEGLAYLQTVL